MINSRAIHRRSYLVHPYSSCPSSFENICSSDLIIS
nr:MAG TPA: hypothetical protein [Caudoviricetes sp.]